MARTATWVALMAATCLVLPQTGAQEDGASPERAAAAEWRPVVLMHGLTASAEAMSHAQSWITADFPGIYTANIEIGNGNDDSMLWNMNKQVDEFARKVAADPKLARGFNVIGHSQGGLIIRGYVARYNSPPVHNMVSWAGPQDGVYGVPDFNALCPDRLCPWLNDLATYLSDGSWADKVVQDHFSFTNYWKPPMNMSAYLKNNIYLADINNERPEKNETYKAHMTSLNAYALLYSTHDDIVVPRTSPWFEFYAPDQDTRIVPFNQSVSYKEDWIGLRTLDEAGKIVRWTANCSHADLPREVCKVQSYDTIVRDLLNNTLP